MEETEQRIEKAPAVGSATGERKESMFHVGKITLSNALSLLWRCSLPIQPAADRLLRRFGEPF